MKSTIRKLLYQSAMGLAKAAPGKGGRHYELGVLKLDRLGDAALSLGAVRRLLMAHDEMDVLLIVSTAAEPLFRAEFPRVALMALPAFVGNFYPDYLSFLFNHARILRGVSVEHLVSLRHQPSDYLHSVAQLLRPRVCYAASVRPAWENVSLGYPNVRLTEYPQEISGQCRELEAHRRVVELALGAPVTMREILPQIHSAQPHDGDALLVCPDAGDPLRIYPPEALAEAVRLAVSERSLPVEICLPPTVDDAPWRLAFGQAGVFCRDWHRPKDVLGLIDVLAGAGVVLANETAPAHLAVAMDKRGVFLLGGGHFGLLAPWTRSQRQRWIYNPLDCYHCRWNCIHSEPYCITQLAPDRVAETVLQVLLA